MIAKLLATTALALTLAGGTAYAANSDTTAPAMAPSASTLMTTGYTATSTDVVASKMMGAKVYDGPGKDAQQIGTVNDLILGQGDKIAAAVIGVGGFLGVGEKNVAVDYDQLKWSKAMDGSNRVELDTTKEALNAAPSFNYPDANPPAQSMNATPDAGAATPTPGATAMAPATNGSGTAATATTGAADNQAAQADVDVSKLQPVDIASMKTDDLKGMDVVNPAGQKLGAIDDFVLTQDGHVDAVVIDFGGFLGIGTKQVAIGYNDLHFLSDGQNKRYLELNVTKAQLDAQQAFDKNTYPANRDQQRMVVSS